MSTVALIQARMGSSRLPGKVLLDLGGRPVLDWVVSAARRIPGVDRVAVATTGLASDDRIVEWCGSADVSCHRGSEDDVLARFEMAASAEGADVVLRLTADCPLLDPVVCGEVLMLLRSSGADYASNAGACGWPDGLDCEAFKLASLQAAAAGARRPSDREHVTTYIRNNRYRFRVESLVCPIPGLHDIRLTVDDERDLRFLRGVLERLAPADAHGYLAVAELLRREPALMEINAGAIRNAGLAKSRMSEPPPAKRSYATSQALYRKALARIPTASQTFSKAAFQYPHEAAPLFLTHGEGGRVWDVDGNEYVDLVMALLPVLLGYQDPDVDAAIRRQMSSGISFSLSTDLERQLAERLCELIPCAEMARFGKTGTDVTTAAIRVARACTRRDRVAICGYHGWQDWYIGRTSRNKGVPETVRELTHVFPYNDAAALEALLGAHRDEFAAVIMEPMNVSAPHEGYLQAVKDLAHAHGALLVFDEVITGFRFSLGGAQELLGVTPDLAVFGKGLGNGMPISAIVGSERYMREMEEIFFSGTFGGETLSIAAAIAVLDKLRREPVLETIARRGQQLCTDVEAAIARHGLDEVVRLNGHPAWKILAIQDHPAARKEAIKTLLLRELLGRGVLLSSSHNVCYAHGDAEHAAVVNAYGQALAVVAAELERPGLEDRLGGPVIQPVFKVR